MQLFAGKSAANRSESEHPDSGTIVPSLQQWLVRVAKHNFQQWARWERDTGVTLFLLSSDMGNLFSGPTRDVVTLDGNDQLYIYIYIAFCFLLSSPCTFLSGGKLLKTSIPCSMAKHVQTPPTIQSVSNPCVAATNGVDMRRRLKNQYPLPFGRARPKNHQLSNHYIRPLCGCHKWCGRVWTPKPPAIQSLPNPCEAASNGVDC